MFLLHELTKAGATRPPRSESEKILEVRLIASFPRSIWIFWFGTKKWEMLTAKMVCRHESEVHCATCYKLKAMLSCLENKYLKIYGRSYQTMKNQNANLLSLTLNVFPSFCLMSLTRFPVLLHWHYARSVLPRNQINRTKQVTCTKSAPGTTEVRWESMVN